MTKAELTQKVKDNPDHCPFCGSGDIEVDGYPDYLDLEIHQSYRCRNCKEGWGETHKFYAATADCTEG